MVLVACQGEPPSPADSPSAADSGEAPFDTAGLDPRLRLGPVDACPNPVPLSRQEVGEQLGLPEGPDPAGDHINGGGAALADLDEDGDLDLVLSYQGRAPWICLWEGSAFACDDRDPDGNLLEGAGYPTLADLDGDGDLDLALSGEDPRLFTWEGAGFRAAGSLPVEEDSQISMVSAADLDGDGRVDLYLARTSPEEDPGHRHDLVLWNQGGLSWVEQDLSELVPDSTGKAFQAVVFDWQADGDPDLYLINDQGAQHGGNALIGNEGGTLFDAGAACTCDLEHSGMGVDAADWSGDGRADLFLAATEKDLLLESQSDDSFVDVTAPTGANHLEGLPEMAWGAAFLDHDNDGDLDLLVAEGDLWAAAHPGEVFEAPITLLEWQGEAFVDVSLANGLLRSGSHRATIPADLNGDGVLDLLVTDVVARPSLYLSEGCTAEGWLAVNGPLGTRVEATVGGVTHTAWVGSGSGFAGSRPAEAWLGLGADQVVDRLVITLPWGGGELVVEDLPARRRLWVDL